MGKGLLGLLLSCVVAIVAVWIGARFGWVNLGSRMYEFAVGATMFILAFKIIVAGLAAHEFTWSGHAYDCCIMTLGASAPALAISVALRSDDMVLWLGVTALAIVSTALTASVRREIADRKSAANVVLVGLGLLTGTFNLGLYVLLAIEKAEAAGILPVA